MLPGICSGRKAPQNPSPVRDKQPGPLGCLPSRCGPLWFHSGGEQLSCSHNCGIGSSSTEPGKQRHSPPPLPNPMNRGQEVMTRMRTAIHTVLDMKPKLNLILPTEPKLNLHSPPPPRTKPQPKPSWNQRLNVNFFPGTKTQKQTVPL